MASSTTCISVSDIVGAMDGDNPHLWFSRDARFSASFIIACVYPCGVRSSNPMSLMR